MTALLETEHDRGLAPHSPAPIHRGFWARRRSLIVVVAALVGWVGALTWSSYFFWDDYLYFAEAQRDGLSLSFLIRKFPFGSHFSPGHRFGDWFIQSLFPLNFRVAQASMLAFFAGTVALLYLVLIELLGPSRHRWALLLSALYGTSVVPVAVVGWWGTALLRMPPAFFALVSLWGWLRFRRTGGRWALVVSVGALVLAMGFYVKALLIPFYLLGLRVLVVEPERPVGDSIRGLAQEWRVWLAYVIPVVVYLGVFLTGYWQPSNLASPGTFVEYLKVSWFGGFVPSMAGFYRAEGEASLGLPAGLIVLQIPVIALVAASVWRSARAWRAWAFFAGAFLANALVVGLPLLGGLGPSIGYRLMYHLEPTYLFPIAIGVAFAAIGPTRSWPRSAALGKTAMIAVLAVLVVGRLASAWNGGRAAASDSPGPQARAYLGNVREDLDRLADQGVRPTLLDGTVPEYVVSSYLLWGASVSYQRYSELFRLIDPDLAFDRRAESLFRVADDGHLSAVTFVADRGGDARRLVRTGELVVEGGAVEVGSEALCVSADAAPASLLLPGFAAGPGERRLAIGYAASRPLTLTVSTGSTADPGLVRALAPQGQLDAVLVDLPSPTAGRPVLEVPPGGRLCLGDIELGRVVPAASADAGRATPVAPPRLDTFDRPDDSSRLGGTVGAARWRTPAGTWGTRGRKAVVDQLGAGRSLAVVDGERSDGIVQVQVDEVGTGAGLVFRYRDPTNYWAVEAVPNYATWTVVKVVGGVSRVMADSGPTGTAAGTVVNVRMEGDRIDVVVGSQSITVVDGTFRDATMVGMTASGAGGTTARFDDFGTGPLP